MATKKISELDAISKADDKDVLVIVNVSENETYKITKKNFFTEMEARVKEIADNQVSGEASGQNLNLVDCAEQTIKSIKIKGNSTQETYSGKNLFDRTQNVTGTSGATVTQNDTGIKVTSSAAGTDKYIWYELYDFEDDLLGQTITISTEMSPSASNNGAIRLFWVNTTLATQIGEALTASGSKTYSIDSSYPSGTYGIAIVFSSNYSGTGAIGNYVDYTKVQIEIGSVATEYEKFLGGTPSPNFDYQQEIKSTGDVKNIYFLPTTDTVSGIEFTTNSDGTINLSGTATANSTFVLFKDLDESYIKDGETYTLWANQELPSGVEFRLEAFNGETWTRHILGYVLNSTRQLITAEANVSGATRVRYLIYIANGTTVDITNLGVQLENWNWGTSFEKAGTGFVNNKFVSKNIFDKNNPIILNAFVNGSNGVLSVPTNNQKSIVVELMPNTTFTVSGVERASSNYGLFDDDKLEIGESIATQKGNITNGEITITTGNDTKWLVFLLGGGSETYGYNDIQIEANSSKTEYAPYLEKVFKIPCQQTMRKIGDLQDTFVKINGIWYERHYIGETILNGSEDGYSASGPSNNQYFVNRLVIKDLVKNPASSTDIVNMICSSFIAKSSSVITGRTEDGISVHNGQIQFYSKKNRAKTLNYIKQQLAENNMKLIYELATPLDLVCTEEQEDALNKIEAAKTFKGTTNVLSNNITPAYLDVTYIKDLETIINNLASQ